MLSSMFVINFSRNMKLKFLRLFAQLNIAIILLLVIAGFSVLATIIEQDQTVEYSTIDSVNVSYREKYFAYNAQLIERNRVAKFGLGIG